MDKLERSVTFSAAYDKRDKDPCKDYGIHGVEIKFLLKGAEGATQFVLYTNWHLPHVTKEMSMRYYEPIDNDPHWMERPQPADLGYHSLVPQYDGQTVVNEECSVLDGRPCYYDSFGLRAEVVYHELLTKGDQGVWAALEEEYKRLFDVAQVSAEGMI